MSRERVAIIGAGNVGASLIDAIHNRRFEDRVEISHVLVRDVPKERFVRSLHGAVPLVFPRERFVAAADFATILADRNVRIILHAAGGDDPDQVLACLRHGKHVITSNKQIIAKHGNDILRTAARLTSKKPFVGIEACVAAQVPIIAFLDGYARTHEVVRIRGQMNGTCAFILDREASDSVGYDESLKEAIRAGYAEDPPDMDVNGEDAAAKALITAAIATRRPLLDETHYNQIAREGIQKISPLAHRFARHFGDFVVKHLVTIDITAGAIGIRVLPTFEKATSPIGSTRGVENCIVIESKLGGAISIRGPGAGGDATAAAMLSDLNALLSRGTDHSFTNFGDLYNNEPSRLMASSEMTICPVILSESPPEETGVFAEKLRVIAQHDLQVLEIVNDNTAGRQSTPDIIALGKTTLAKLHQVIEDLKKLDRRSVEPGSLTYLEDADGQLLNL